MATLTATCDDCGKHLKEAEIYEDYDATHRCQKCNLEHRFSMAEHDLNVAIYRTAGTLPELVNHKKSEVGRIKKELKKLNDSS